MSAKEEFPFPFYGWSSDDWKQLFDSFDYFWYEKAKSAIVRNRIVTQMMQNNPLLSNKNSGLNTTLLPPIIRTVSFNDETCYYDYLNTNYDCKDSTKVQKLIFKKAELLTTDIIENFLGLPTDWKSLKYIEFEVTNFESRKLKEWKFCANFGLEKQYLKHELPKRTADFLIPTAEFNNKLFFDERKILFNGIDHKVLYWKRSSKTCCVYKPEPFTHNLLQEIWYLQQHYENVIYFTNNLSCLAFFLNLTDDSPLVQTVKINVTYRGHHFIPRDSDITLYSDFRSFKNRDRLWNFITSFPKQEQQQEEQVIAGEKRSVELISNDSSTLQQESNQLGAKPLLSKNSRLG